MLNTSKFEGLHKPIKHETACHDCGHDTPYLWVGIDGWYRCGNCQNDKYCRDWSKTASA